MRSANEISGLVLKAARGAGMALGCAEELAHAAPSLARDGVFDMIVDLLEGPFEPPVLKEGALIGGHPVLAIAAWIDLRAAGRDPTLEHSVSPFLINAMRSEAFPVGPHDVSEQTWERLQAYAERTFVPETDASRLAGAGAGLTDND